jgi:3-isopropylmalate dehydrogenase
MEFTIVLLPGDGIGPEVVAQAVRVLEFVAQSSDAVFHFTEHKIGGCSIDQFGSALTDETLAICQRADAVMLGAVGGPKWDNPDGKVRPEQGLLALRKGLGVFANLRPVKVHPDLISSSPLKPEKLAGVDMIVVRELTGGLYFGQPKGRQIIDGHERAVDTLIYTDDEIRRVVQLAFRLAQKRRQKVTSVDKANVLESSRLWRKITAEVAAEFPEVTLENMLVDTAAMRLVASPASFDIVVTENMFGDILTDEASVLVGSMGMLPSASLGDHNAGLYEPIHGSAPDIAGRGIANPIGTILSAALMLRYSLHMSQEATRIEKAVEQTISAGLRTTDLGGAISSQKMTDEILTRMKQ